MSAEDLDEFDLRRYLRSEEGLRRMLPVVKVSRRVWLISCGLSKASCKMMASVMQGTPSHLRYLDMGENLLLKDEGVELLCDGLRDPQCKLEILRLERCSLTEKSCAALASAARSNSCSLKQLDLGLNKIHDAGVQHLSDLLKNPHCKLEKLV
ncbi:NACHT, LRR and PYD domains-containing protein 12-like [Clupea harengus]|uniref:NACHT, LRR and PYD domains-containing protein 12-like n=1 Tax=Clupea harengus TaxID=7950 RepID=A0A8M1K7A7_CLUHA|nr:NACHT, LRR and PYD domains-containing protein 12-like [Clupea harengus]